MIFALVFLGAAAACVSVRRTRVAVLAALAALAVAVAIAPSTPVGIALAAGVSAHDVPGAPPPGETPGGRLFSTTSNSRTAYWRVAAGDVARHPLAGSGAGTFVREWYRHRRITASVQDAHSLYLETLAELGLVGLALLAAALAAPVFAAVRARGQPLVAATFGAFVAYAVHTGVDWDWELPGLTLIGLLCGTLLVVAARAASERAGRHDRPTEPRAERRVHGAVPRRTDAGACPRRAGRDGHEAARGALPRLRGEARVSPATQPSPPRYRPAP
jgi:hypothetical protein